MEQTMTHCTGMESKLADLLLDPASVSARVHSHVAECDGCRAEMAELRATMELMDTWDAPEPSPYFLSKLDARMREERAAEPAGWLARQIARIRDGFAYGPQHHVRPLAAMAMTVMLLVGGGTYLGVTDWNQAAPQPGQAAVVHDLQTLDSNAQLLDQMEQISSNQNGE